MAFLAAAGRLRDDEEGLDGRVEAEQRGLQQQPRRRDGPVRVAQVEEDVHEEVVEEFCRARADTACARLLSACCVRRVCASVSRRTTLSALALQWCVRRVCATWGVWAGCLMGSVRRALGVGLCTEQRKESLLNVLFISELRKKRKVK